MKDARNAVGSDMERKQGIALREFVRVGVWELEV